MSKSLLGARTRPPRGCDFDPVYHRAFYEAYYRRLFAFLHNASRPYRLVDVRKGNGWRELGPIRDRCPPTGTAFPNTNSRQARTGDYSGRCEALDPSVGFLSRWLGLSSRPSRPFAEHETWVAC